MITATTECRSRRWTIGALGAGLVALLPHDVAPGSALAATSESGTATQPQPASRSQRGKWEYALYDLQTYKATRYNSFFNQLGDEGWELVGMSAYTPVGSRDGEHVLATFKRAK